MVAESIKSYDLLETRKSEDVNSQLSVLVHKKTKAKVILVQNDDENKVFCIGFKTPPKDDTGVAHIVEHSVLCGSTKYPIKDPFVELAKGSLNTFLNAMTYPDKTIYPVASCNDKDFQNLMNVYLDAVFYPNMCKEEKIFMQEGWHYKLENMEDPLTITGVVYNEMKGAFSSPDSVMEREAFNSLFPNTIYGNESGGKPENIPDLTYDNFKDFHASYYHPSNSYIYLYGNADMEEKLRFIDEQYLSAFEYSDINAVIDSEPAFSKMVSCKSEYPVSEGESEEDNTYLSYNTVVSEKIDAVNKVAFQLLDYVLCTVPGAPVKQALIEAGIGKEVYSIFEDGIKQPYFSIVAKGANESDNEKFVKIIEEEIKKLVDNGINKLALKAGINSFEFRYREDDFGSYPRGLIYGLKVLDSWLYDDDMPFQNIEGNAVYDKLKELVETDFFEKLLQEKLLNNNHKSNLVIVPKKGLTASVEKELEDKLSILKASLSNEELEGIIRKTKELEDYQNEENSKEDMEKLPLLKKEDIVDYNFVNEIEVSDIEGTKYIYHDIFTNKIAYIKLMFDINGVDEELLPYVALLKSIMGYVDTKKHSYNELSQEIDLATGGLNTSIRSYCDMKNLEKYGFIFEVKSKVLYKNINKAFELMEEIITSTELDDYKRIKEIIAEYKSGMQASMMSASHVMASGRAIASISDIAAISEKISGFDYYKFIDDIDKNFETKKEEVSEKLRSCIEFLFRKNRMMVDCTATSEVKEEVATCVIELKKKLFINDMPNMEWNIEKSCKKEGLKTSAQVQYVCRAGNFIEKGLPYTGALLCLKVMMGYEYLWNEVRVKGGAYGCMSAFARTGNAYFVSYRDPNLTRTIDTYMGAADFLRNFKMDERTCMKFIIGAISDFDKPLSPASRGLRALSYYLSNISKEDVLKERNEILGFDAQVAVKLADYIDAFLEDDCLCVIGNEGEIAKNSELFEKIDNLI